MDEKIASPAITVNTPSRNYLGLEEEYSSFKKAKAVIMQAPYDRTTTYIHGAANGPEAILEASRYMERFDDELNQETFKMGIHTMDPLAIKDLSSEAMVDKIYAQTLELLKANKFPVILGGEHSVTIGAVKAFKENYSNLSVLQLDAHNDMRDIYFGSKLNHGCVARRISEICPIVQIGTRSMSKEEKDYLSTDVGSKVKTVSVYDILEQPMWKDSVSNSLGDSVYITIDLDVFDPALVPATGTPEPGGLGWYEALSLLKEVAKDKKVVGFDVVELCPIKGSIRSDFLAAKLIYRLLGYVFPAKK